jgi:hypothetical protein
MSIVVSFACNHPDNGDFLGRFEACHIGDFELQCTMIGSSVKLRKVPFKDPVPGKPFGALHVGRLEVGYFYWTCWFGNWCWDGFSVADEDAVAIVNYLMKLKYWTCEGGECKALHKFNAREPLTLEELRYACV